MLSAHGSAPEVVAAARERDRVVVNAVCPLVTKVHHEAKVRAEKGYTVLYVGHAGHDEAVGTLAVAPDAMRLVDHDTELADVASSVPDPTKVALLAQTTLSLHDWQGVMADARDRGSPSLWTASRDDLCFATTNRQQALRELAARADTIVVIGSANSSNTIALTKVAEEAGCERVLRVDGPDELDADVLAGASVVGVTAGASAPEDLVQAVVARLAPRDGVETVHVTDEDEYFPPPTRPPRPRGAWVAQRATASCQSAAKVTTTATRLNAACANIPGARWWVCQRSTPKSRPDTPTTTNVIANVPIPIPIW